MKKILLVLNPVAGKARAKFRIYKVADWFYQKGYLTTVLATAKKNDAADFVKKYADGHELVVCCGGDGTLNEMITGLIESQCEIPLGYLPAGTTNDMAKTLHLPGNLNQAAKIILNEKPIPQDVGLFNGTQYFTYIASFGAFTRASYATPQWLKNRLGHLAYVFDGIRSVGNIQPYRIQIISSEVQEEDDFVFGSVTNSLSVGGTFRLKREDVCLNDGQFEVMLIRNPRDLRQTHNILHALVHQNYQQESNILFFHTNKILFRFKKGTTWTVDGEFAGQPDEVQIENLHNAVQIIRKP